VQEEVTSVEVLCIVVRCSSYINMWESGVNLLGKCLSMVVPYILDCKAAVI
jgi:hypothetical protein